jgi:hypothetical protein
LIASHFFAELRERASQATRNIPAKFLPWARAIEEAGLPGAALKDDVEARFEGLKIGSEL